MPHPSEHGAVARPLGGDEAEELARTLKALASAGRLRLLTELVREERTVEQLAAAAELSVSATSHHLRLLRALRLVRARRDGRHVVYTLHDHHLAELPAAVRHHHEHVHPPAGWICPTPPPSSRRDRAQPQPMPAATATGSSIRRSSDRVKGCARSAGRSWCSARHRRRPDRRLRRLGLGRAPRRRGPQRRGRRDRGPARIAFALRSARAERFAGLLVVLPSSSAPASPATRRSPGSSIRRTSSTSGRSRPPAARGFLGNWIAARIRTRAGRRLDSPALIADGAHARADAYVSLAVIGSAIAIASRSPGRRPGHRPRHHARDPAHHLGLVEHRAVRSDHPIRMRTCRGGRPNVSGRLGLGRRPGDPSATRRERMRRQRSGAGTERPRRRGARDADARVEPRGGAEPDGVHARLPHHPGVARGGAARR